ncbi:hypothetical protein AMTRI_Chr02g258830 [Amborella trichopoda]
MDAAASNEGDITMDMDDNYTQDEDDAKDDEETDKTMENNWRDPTSLGDFGQGGTTRNVLDWRGGTTAVLQTPPSLTQIFCPVNPDSETQQYHDPPRHSHDY